MNTQSIIIGALIAIVLFAMLYGLISFFRWLLSEVWQTIKMLKRVQRFFCDGAFRDEVLAKCKVIYSRQREQKRAYDARSRFVRRRHSWDDNRRSNDDLNPLVIGSSAWLIQQNLTSVFSTSRTSNSSSSFDHSSFASTIQAFDDSLVNPSSPFDPNSPWSDWVTGGTDMSGAHGMGGHHDQFPSSFGSDSFSSAFSSHDSFSSSDSFSSHDPFA